MWIFEYHELLTNMLVVTPAEILAPSVAVKYRVITSNKKV